MVAGLALVCAPSAALAKKRVVLFDFIGPGADGFRSQVRQMLRRRATLLSPRTYRRAARRLRVRRHSPGNVRRIARRINASGMVGGRVRRLPGRRYRIHISMRSGRTGRIVASFSVTNRGRRLRGRARREMIANLRVGVRRFHPPRRGRGDDVRRRRRRRAAARRRAARRRAAARKSRGDDDDTGDIGDIGDSDDRSDRSDRSDRRSRNRVSRRKKSEDKDDTPAALTDEEKADRKVRSRGLIIAGGLSVSKRSFDFNYDAGLANPPRGYSGNAVAGAYVTADLFPLAMDAKSRGAVRDIGVTFYVDKVIKINSQLIYNDPMTMAEMRVDLPTEQMRWGVGAVIRHNFGKTPKSPSVRLVGRYNRFTFDIDKTAAPAGVSVDIPNVDYTSYDVGLGIRYPLSGKLAILLQGYFMLMQSTGEISDTTQFGGADVSGLDADGGFEYKLQPRLYLLGGVRYTRIGFAFDGTGDLSMGVAGALDEYLGGYATLQYLF